MAVDDRAINNLRTWYDSEYEALKDEWKSGQFERFTNCPSFKSTSAYRKALNILIEERYLPEYVESYKIPPLRKSISEVLHNENFWKEKKTVINDLSNA
ncbi:hypothetical protein [Rummeliibacillus pycnus]|uniref:hypothetical protein n=1 Tax=Rummeliibacillus pycnus TaxID=101070 RepID=UPI003D2BBF19